MARTTAQIVPPETAEHDTAELRFIRPKLGEHRCFQRGMDTSDAVRLIVLAGDKERAAMFSKFLLH